MKSMVTVIVPIYNVEEYLDKCLESIVKQTYKNLEIILVDDGSPDNCPKICDNWSQKDERIKVIHKTNGGLSDARNAGLDIAQGDYIFFVDSDDWIEQNMIEKLLKKIEEVDGDICSCGIIYEYFDHSSPTCIPDFVGDSYIALENLYSNAKFPVCAWNKLYKKELWNQFRYPVGKICEDAFTTYLLVDKSDKIIQIHEPLYHYRIRENSIMTTSFSHKKMDEEEAWRKNYEFIKANYFDLYYKAFEFYLLRVHQLIGLIPKHEKRYFQNEYLYLKGILKSNLLYILFKSAYSLKLKIRIICDYFKF